MFVIVNDLHRSPRDRVNGCRLSTPASKPYTVKNIRISTDILWRVFHILTKLVWYVSVNRQNNKAWANIAIWAHTSLFHQSTDPNVYGTGSVKICKNRHKIYGYILQCSMPPRHTHWEHVIKSDTLTCKCW